MANYLIFTESTGDLTPALIEQTGLQVLPMSFTLDGNTYRNYPDGREIALVRVLCQAAHRQHVHHQPGQPGRL